MRTGLKRLSIVAIVVGILLYVGNLFIDNPYSHRVVRTLINEQFSTNTNLTIDFEALKVRLAPPGIDMYAVAVSSTAKIESPLIKSSHARARLSLFDLLLGKVKLAVELTDAETAWPLPVDPSTLLKPDPKPQNKKSEPATWPPKFDLPISRLVLNNARVSLILPDDNPDKDAPSKDLINLVATSFDLDWTIDDWDDQVIRTRIGSLNIDMPSEKMHIFQDATIELTAGVDGKGLKGKRLRMYLPKLEAGGNLTGEFVTKGKNHELQRIKLKCDAHALGDLSVLGKILNIEHTSGETNADAVIRLEIPVADGGKPLFVVEGQASVKNGYMDKFGLGNSNAKFIIDTKTLQFTEINAITGDRLVGKASGKISFNEAVDFQFEGKPEKLVLSELLKMLTVNFDLVDGDLSSSDLSVKGTGEPFYLEANATVQMDKVRTPLLKDRAQKYTYGPTCRLPLKIKTNNKRLTLFEGQGSCFHWPEPSGLLIPKPGDLTAPSGALFVSPLTYGGTFPFNDREPMTLSFHSSALQLGLSQHFSQLQTKGIANLDATVSGPYKHIITDVDLKAQEIELAGAKFDTLNGSATVVDKKVSWKNIEATTGNHGSIRSESGELTFDDYHLKAKLLVADIPALFVQEVLKHNAKLETFDFGFEHIQADLSGPLLKPLRMQGEAKIALNNGRYEDIKLFDRLAWSMRRATDKGWNIDNLRFTTGDFGLTGSIAHEPSHNTSAVEPVTEIGRVITALGLQASDKIDIDVSSMVTRSENPATGLGRMPELPPDHLASIPYAAEYFKLLGMRGEVSGSAKLNGTFNRLQGAFQVAVSKISVLNSPMAPFHFRGFADGSKLDIMLSHSGDALQGRLAVDFLDKQLPYEWYLHAKRFDARPLGTRFFYQDPRNYAYVTAGWDMKGHFTDWWQSTGTASIDDLRVKFIRDSGQSARALDLNLDQPIKFTFNPDGWNIDNKKDLLLTGNSLRFRVATKNNRPPSNFGLLFDGFFDISILKDVWDQIESASGQVRFSGEIAGSAKDPKIGFHAADVEKTTLNASTWEPLSLGMADIRPPFRNIKVNADFQNGQVFVRSLTAEKGNGRINVDGVVNMDPSTGQQTLLNINANNATVIYPVAVFKSFDTNIDTNLTLSGTTLPLRLAGDVNIARARSFRDFDIRNEIVDALRKRTMVSEPTLRQPVLLLDLGVRARNSVTISNRNLQAMLAGDLQITGTDVNPIVNGQVEVVRGKFEYKREFRIEQGLISFDDPVKPDPRLNIVGVSEVSSYRVYVTITGKASNPRVDLTVDPPTRDGGTPISKVDILVLLSSGALPESGKQFGESQAAATTEALNIVAGQFEEPVEKLFDLSGQKVVRQVYIDTTSDVDGKPVPRFNMPLNLGEDVNVVLRVVDQNKWRVSSEYSLHESISLSGNLDGQDNSTSNTNRTNTPADTGVDLKFRFAYP